MLNPKLPHILSDNEMDIFFIGKPAAARNFVDSGDSVLLLPGQPVRFSILNISGKTVKTGLNMQEVKDYYDRS